MASSEVELMETLGCPHFRTPYWRCTYGFFGSRINGNFELHLQFLGGVQLMASSEVELMETRSIRNAMSPEYTYGFFGSRINGNSLGVIIKPRIRLMASSEVELMET